LIAAGLKHAEETGVGFCFDCVVLVSQKKILTTIANLKATLDAAVHNTQGRLVFRIP
jgi:hypothetical protein